MTQAAVSYAIKGLETQLGVSLFQRAPPPGRADRSRRALLRRRLARPVAYPQIGRGAARARPAAAHVTLSASTAFASFWMVPRLQKFRDDLPGIDLRIQTADRDLDLVAEGIPARHPRRLGRGLAGLRPAADRAGGDLCRRRPGLCRALGHAAIARRPRQRAADPSGRAVPPGGDLERMVPVGRASTAPAPIAAC